MLLLRDYTKVNLPHRFLEVNDQGGVLGEFALKPWLADNAEALADNAEGVGLKVRVLASMSGVLINRRVYPGVEWKKAAPFFAERPFLMHHNSYGDAVGRIFDGEFEQKRKGSGFENDWKRPRIQELGKTPRPSGILYVNGTITDPSIIEQAEDKRVFHVSQGSRAKIGECSICNSNMAAHEWCDHRPGQWYDKETGDRVTAGSKNAELAYTIIRDLIPVEVSFVTDPALAAARIMEFEGVTDSETMARCNEYTSEINTTDTILEDDISEMVLMGINGKTTRLRLVNDSTTVINSPATEEPKVPEVTAAETTEVPEVPEVDTTTYHQPKDSADTIPVAAKSSDNGAYKMDWEKKFADRTEELLETRADLKEAQIESERAKAKLETKDAEAVSLRSDVEARDARIAELEEDVKDGEGANKTLLNEVRTVYLDRYEASLMLSRPDLKEEDVKAAREELADKALDAVKLLVSEKEKFAKSPLETHPSKTDGDDGESTNTDEKASTNDTQEEIEEDDGGLF